LGSQTNSSNKDNFYQSVLKGELMKLKAEEGKFAECGEKQKRKKG
jgi:hypothetical protein